MNFSIYLRIFVKDQTIKSIIIIALYDYIVIYSISYIKINYINYTVTHMCSNIVLLKLMGSIMYNYI